MVKVNGQHYTLPLTEKELERLGMNVMPPTQSFSFSKRNATQEQKDLIFNLVCDAVERETYVPNWVFDNIFKYFEGGK